MLTEEIKIEQDLYNKLSKISNLDLKIEIAIKELESEILFHDNFVSGLNFLYVISVISLGYFIIIMIIFIILNLKKSLLIV